MRRYVECERERGLGEMLIGAVRGVSRLFIGRWIECGGLGWGHWVGTLGRRED